MRTITTSETIELDADLIGPLEIRSSANPVIRVAADDVTISRVNIVGTSQGQVGIHVSGKTRGTIDRCDIARVSIGVKLEESSDDWLIERCWFSGIGGTEAGSGYGILCGNSSWGKISRCEMRGRPGCGRHFVYLSDASSRWVIADCYGRGLNSSTFAVYSLQDQQPCNANQFLRCMATDQARGPAGAAAFEISGRATRTILRDCEASSTKGIGILVSTQGWVSYSDTVIENCRITDIDEEGILLRGSRRVRIADNVIRNVSQGSPGSSPCIRVKSWYQSDPKARSEDVVIRGNTFGVVGARNDVTIDSTDPRPQRVTQDGNVVEQ